VLGLAVTMATEVVTWRKRQQPKIMINLFGALLRPAQMTCAVFSFLPPWIIYTGVVIGRSPRDFDCAL